MTKDEFFSELNKHLKGIPLDERQDMLRDFKEHFEMAQKDGKTEKQITKDIGNPKTLAKSIKADFFIDQAKTHFSWNQLQQALVASIGLSIFNFIFILSPFLLVVTIIASLIIAGPIVMISSFALFFQINFLQAIFNAFVFFGFGLLLLVLGVYLAKNFYRLLLRYLEWNKKLIRG